MARSDWRQPTTFPLPPGHRRIRLLLSYDGYGFSGWQRQKTDRSVQEEIEKALFKIIGEHARIQGSGRTDAKVHALGQVAHVDIRNQSVPAEIFAIALNQKLPHDVRIIESRQATEQFHARYSTVCREYRYYAKELAHCTPFDRNRVCRLRRFPSIDLLNAYATYSVGTHDFTTFSAVADQSTSRIRNIYTSEFSFEDSQWGGKFLVYTVRGNAFLMHQVRSMVGTMLQLGESCKPPEEFCRRLEMKDRFQAGKTAPPGGLYLYRVEYETE